MNWKFAILPCIWLLLITSYFLQKIHFDIFYSDSGLMWIQIKDFIDSNFSSFAFNYRGQSLDPNYSYIPFHEPYMGFIDQIAYIDFPPYFPVFVSVFYLFLSNLGIYIVEILSLIVSSAFLFLFIRLWKIDYAIACVAVFLYLFGTTMQVYIYAVHEYSIALMFFNGGTYFLFSNSFRKNKKKLILGGIFFGLSIYFRLELTFVLLCLGLLVLIRDRKEFLNIVLYFGLPFILVFISMLFLNNSIHGHPLGFRYTLTMQNEITVNNSRSQIIYELLFGSNRGFFKQSPYLILCFIPIFYWIKDFKFQSAKLYISIAFILSTILLLSFAPNHGDHISPRYLFGTYPLAFLLFGFFLQIIVDKLKIEYRELKFSHLTRIISTNILLSLALVYAVIASIYSFTQYSWAIKYIRDADNQLYSINSLLKDRIEDIFVFTELDLPLNLQSLYYDKIFLHVPEQNLEKFIAEQNKLKVDKKRMLVISMPNSKINASLNGKDCIRDLSFCKSSQTLPMGITLFTSK
ncbi:LA_3751/LA_3752 family putative glycosyltransferase [Leptospira sp. GIMC2001]|uniref:LA_3751/LA_3752 family putative glycosyltransferase n=1 Tax=Leptospira sp. GIMC2001 TaxID=1513297 RepID=UPI00234AD318|nr:hypothetical protein [Leptospira sp. GIMC2001]WCL48350.1 hypothetical protein O4O04_13675 [Leptospira sp. GIMC2001]